MKIKEISYNAKNFEIKTTEREQTTEELKRISQYQIIERIEELKLNLSKTDYQAIKFAEGLISKEEYSEIKTQRQSWRDEINRLEKLV